MDLAPDNPFHTDTPLYRKSRPAYPVTLMEQLLSYTHPIRAVDIGSGTGKLTLMLAQHGAHVYAVEPSETMRAQMPTHPLIHPVAATAEETTLPEKTADLVTFAQSWHWVDPQRAGAEADRITTDTGTLAIVWNQMDVTYPWVHRLSRIMRSGDVHRPDQPPTLPTPWAPPTLWREDWKDVTTPEQLMELGTTRSSYLRQNAHGRARMQNNLRWYLYEHLNFAPHQPVALPYMTLAWIAHKVHKPQNEAESHKTSYPRNVKMTP